MNILIYVVPLLALVSLTEADTFFSILQAANPRGPDVQGPEMDSAMLLVEEGEDEHQGFVAATNGVVSKHSQAKAEGVELLKADLRWLWRLLVTGTSWALLTLKAVSADILAWATAFVSFRLTRALLIGGEDKVVEKSMVADDDALHSQDEHVVAEAAAGEEQPADESSEEWQRLVANAVVSERDVFGCSLLHMAAHHGQTKAAEQLLQMGFDPNAVEHFQETPLHMTARSGCIATAKLLLSYGADPKVRNCFGKTPLAVAMHTEPRLAAVLREAAIQASDRS
mmetsp:Transcript_42360/g.78960  ORF Transcript_42360/g.78960 Transcript_42360/m.78960 type:complete len:283 (-) Transcript_42360:106-954(-)